jgi:magnesium-transporting ATPase (P-type)
MPFLSFFPHRTCYNWIINDFACSFAIYRNKHTAIPSAFLVFLLLTYYDNIMSYSSFLKSSFTETTTTILEHFSVDIRNGLSEDQVFKYAQRYGKNGMWGKNVVSLVLFYIHTSYLLELPKEPPTPLWTLVLQQFSDLLVIILLVAAMISFVLAFFEESDSLFSAFVEPIVILLILIANATVGVVQETNAETAIQVSKLNELAGQISIFL